MKKILFWLDDDSAVHLAFVGKPSPPFHFRAAGTSFRQDEIQEFRQRWVPRGGRFAVWLWPEPENAHHSRAIRLMAVDPVNRESCHVGYVPRELANDWFQMVTEFEEATGFHLCFPATFLGGTPELPTLGILVAAAEPGDWMTAWERAA